MSAKIQRAFSSGEVGPALWGRSDQVKHATGLKTCRNFFVQRFGGVTNRAGSVFICELKDSSKRARLVKFIFNDEQTYALEFGDLYMRVIRNGAQLLSVGVPYEIATPYLEADLQDLNYVQSGDVVTIVHPSYSPHELQRTGHTTWSLVLVTTVPSIAAPTGQGAVAGVGGSIVFNYMITAIDADTDDESDLSAVASCTAGTPTSTTPNVISWSAVAGAAEYNVYKEENGIYGFIGTAGGTTFNDINIAPDMSFQASDSNDHFSSVDDYPSTVTYAQQRRVFANTNNDPEKVFASRTGRYSSFNTHTPLQDDDAVTFTLAGRKVNEVRHVIDLGGLIVLTAGAEVAMRGNADGVLTPSARNPETQGYNGSSRVMPIVVGNTALFVQSRGSHVRDIEYARDKGHTGREVSIFSPHLVDSNEIVDWDFQQIPHSVVWAVRDDGVLLGLTYVRNHEVEGWSRHDTDGLYENVISIPEGREDAVYTIVKRVIDGQTKRYIERFHSRNVTDIAVDAFFVDCGLTYDGRNTDTGHTMTLSGGVTWEYDDNLILTSSAAYFDAGEVGNAIHLKVDIIDPVTLAVIGVDVLRCKISDYTSSTIVSVVASKDVPVLFRSVAISNWARAVDGLSGLDHLEGKRVSVLGDGNVESVGHDDDALVVTSGAITLSNTYGIIHVGLPIQSDFQTLDIDSAEETLVHLLKRTNELTIQVEASRGIWAGENFDKLTEKRTRSNENPGEPIALFTGSFQMAIKSTWNSGGSFAIRQNDPLPLNILSVAPSVDLGG